MDLRSCSIPNKWIRRVSGSKHATTFSRNRTWMKRRRYLQPAKPKRPMTRRRANKVSRLFTALLCLVAFSEVGLAAPKADSPAPAVAGGGAKQKQLSLVRVN